MEKHAKKQILFLCLTCSLLLGWGVQHLHAHTALIESSPEAGKSTPELLEIELTFATQLVDDGNAKIRLATIREGIDMPIGETTFISDYIIRANIPTVPDPGQYVVRYHVTSLDGDLNDGGYAFELLAPKGTSVTWVLLGIGVGLLALVMFLLRPKAERDNS
jgi:methionine-rich copper-binding protein CopC